MYKRLFSLIIALFIGINAVYAQEANWMPDPNLRKAIRQKLEIDTNTPLTKADMLELRRLDASRFNITNLTGLEYAINLEFLIVAHNHIQDIRPLANLTRLTFLDLGGNAISDISPLAGLVNLEALGLWYNQIVNVSPLVGLVNLKDLALQDNQITDISPLIALTRLMELNVSNNWIADLSPLIALTAIEVLEIEGNPGSVAPECELSRPSIIPRIEDREYPSVFGSWSAVQNRPPILPRLPWLSEDGPIAYFDLYFSHPAGHLGLDLKYTNVSVHLTGDFQRAKERRDALLAYNPNAMFLVPVIYYSGLSARGYPEDGVLHELWLRDENGKRIVDNWGDALLDFTLPETQKWAIDQAKAIAACGLFDGIFLDHWSEGRRLREIRSLEAEHIARDNILQGIRAVVDDDFLIMVNTNEDKIPRWAEYVNGTYMETYPTLETPFGEITDVGEQYRNLGYSRETLYKIEETLIWSENHLREPRINGLTGFGIEGEPPDSLRNQQWMRIFTTLSLTHSDGYVEYQFRLFSLSINPSGGEPVAYWSPFWDADLGKSVGEKGVLYRNRDGLYIREYTNGWAVYNRSGAEQQIEFPEQVSGVESGVTDTEHSVPDLDGEIYLKATIEMTNPVDVNNDGTVNVLDLVLVAQHLGETVAPNSEVDVNGDGIVNILDLTLVAGHLGGETAAAPAIVSGTPDAAMIQAWIEQAQLENDGSIAFQHAIAKLQELLALLIPEKTALLPNYPNPFNPETWIPYHLANPSEVTISIYDTRGSVIRQLNLEHQHAGHYTDQSRAAYWDGRNEVGERVASGIYFYQLKTENASLLRKMLILK